MKSNYTPSSTSRFVYRTMISNMPVYATFIVGAGIVANILFNEAGDALWASANHGKSFDEVIHKFPQWPPGTEPEEPPPAEESTESEESSDSSSKESTGGGGEKTEQDDAETKEETPASEESAAGAEQEHKEEAPVEAKPKKTRKGKKKKGKKGKKAKEEGAKKKTKKTKKSKEPAAEKSDAAAVEAELEDPKTRELLIHQMVWSDALLSSLQNASNASIPKSSADAKDEH